MLSKNRREDLADLRKKLGRETFGYATLLGFLLYMGEANVYLVSAGFLAAHQLFSITADMRLKQRQDYHNAGQGNQEHWDVESNAA